MFGDATRPRALAWLLALACVLLVLSVCQDGDAEGEQGKRAPRGMTETERKVREGKARALLQQGSVAPVKQKLKIFESVIARYPETSLAPKAYFLLVHNFLAYEIMDYRSALVWTKAFGERHPEDPLYSECYRQLYRGSKARDWGDAFVVDVARSWRKNLDRSLAEGHVEGEAELLLRLDKAHLLFGEGQKEQALECFEEAVAVLPVENKRYEMQALMDLACLQAQFAARQDDARATFKRAKKVLESWKSTSYTKEDIDKLMRKLGLLEGGDKEKN